MEEIVDIFGITDGKKCEDICKYAPPENKWPCVDCDIRCHDRAEPKEEVVDVSKTDFDIIQSNTENLKKYIESVTLKSTNIQMDEKCVYCPYMFEYKCRKSSCVFDDCQNSNNV